jgi:hypothetical protein
MALIAERTVQPRSTGRFYVGMASVAALTAFVGFAPTVFLRGVLAPVVQSATLAPLLVVHGLANTLWIVLFLSQVSRRIAIASRCTDAWVCSGRLSGRLQPVLLAVGPNVRMARVGRSCALGRLPRWIRTRA